MVDVWRQPAGKPGLEQEAPSVATQTPRKQASAGQVSGTEQPRILWDDSNMKSAYANVCNAVGTREEVVLFFGVSNPAHDGQSDVAVELSQRVILSPFAARRLVTILSNVVEQYESRWGSLKETPTEAGKS